MSPEQTPPKKLSPQKPENRQVAAEIYRRMPLPVKIGLGIVGLTLISGFLYAGYKGISGIKDKIDSRRSNPTEPAKTESANPNPESDQQSGNPEESRQSLNSGILDGCELITYDGYLSDALYKAERNDLADNDKYDYFFVTDIKVKKGFQGWSPKFSDIQNNVLKGKEVTVVMCTDGRFDEIKKYMDALKAPETEIFNLGIPKITIPEE